MTCYGDGEYFRDDDIPEAAWSDADGSDDGITLCELIDRENEVERR